MSLTDTAIKNSKPKSDKAFKMPDEKGMYLLVNPSGGKYFRFDYRFNGKCKTLALGVYPDTSLKQVREIHDKAREQLAQGIDPSENKKAAKVALSHTFEHVTRAFLTSIAHTVRDVTHQKKLRRFELHTFPCIGSMAISDIKSPDIYNILKPIISLSSLKKNLKQRTAYIARSARFLVTQ